jgi:replication factor C small subunit
MSVELWTEKYRPETLDDYVWRDLQQRRKAEEWIADGALPHLLFSGPTGIGKTSLALLLLKMLRIPSGDILKIPASRNRKIEEIQEKILAHCQTWALNDTGFKYIILDEADGLSPHAQKLLRNEMEEYADSCRFILTCNYPQRIIEPVHGRCQTFQFKTLDRDEFTARLGEILTRENVTFEIEPLLAIVEAKYPDLRKCINIAQESTIGGVLHTPDAEDISAKEYLIEMANLVRVGQMAAARKLVVAQAQIEEYPDIYRFLYRNLDLWGETEDQHDAALIEIRKGLVNHTLVADPEINLAATLVSLKMVLQAA